MTYNTNSDVRRNEALSRGWNFLRLRHGEIWMLTLYAKNVSENIPARVLKKIKEQIDAEN